MKAKSALLQLVLAVVGLTLAYMTWQRPKNVSVEKRVTIADATKQSLELVHFEDGTRFVELHREGDVNWVKVGYLPGKEPAPVDAGTTMMTVDAGVDGGLMQVALPPPMILPTRETRANERATEIFTKMTPFEATRALGVLPAEKLAELGLSDSERKLELTIAGVKRAFAISRVMPGVIGAWAQDLASKEVFLLDGTTLTDLDPSSLMLVDRRLHTFKAVEFDRFTVKLGGKQAEFIQTNADIQQTAKVARVATPEKGDEIAKNWHDKIWSRLVVTEVLGKGEVPRGGEPEVALRIDYTSNGKQKGFLELGFDKNKSTWGRSENTANWVAIHQGSEEIIIEATRLTNP